MTPLYILSSYFPHVIGAQNNPSTQIFSHYQTSDFVVNLYNIAIELLAELVLSSQHLTN